MTAFVALIALLGSHHSNEVEATYKAALDQAISCQKTVSQQSVDRIKPVESNDQTAIVGEVSDDVMKICAREHELYYDAVAARVRLNHPVGKKKQQAIVTGVLGHAQTLMYKTSVVWSKTALKQYLGQSAANASSF